MSLARAALQSAKRILLPQGRQFRRVLWGPAAGCWMMLDLNHELRLYLGVYERELAKSFRELLRPGMKGFDIGGRDGYSALAIASRTGAEVVSFECEGESAAAMRQVFDRNPLRIRVVTAFVGADDSAPGRVTVDRAASEFFKPDFIKIDVEGAEVDVLRGAGAVLSSHRPAMIIEVHGTEAEAGCREILAGHGYHVEVIDRSRIFPERRPLPHNRWLVCRPSGARSVYPPGG